ncbi:hypothetical protein GGI12_005778, partial [Dipsacomyces acuminosporus]
RTQALLRKHANRLQNRTAAAAAAAATAIAETANICCYSNNGEDEVFTHARSVNVVWRQWAVGHLQLPRYPPELINWNKDADPVFLYAPMPALRLEVPWSTHKSLIAKAASKASPKQVPLKPALKRTDLQTFLTSPTLSPVSSPAHSPLHSPALSIRENLSSSSLGSDSTLDSEAGLKPRLRFNDCVEQCMVVFKNESECLPAGYGESDYSSEDEGDVNRGSSSDGGRYYSASGKSSSSARRTRSNSSRNRRTLVIKLAPTPLKGDHRRLVSVTANPSRPFGTSSVGYDNDSDDEDFFSDYNNGIALFGGPAPSERPVASSSSSSSSSSVSGGSGVTDYVQGYMQSVAGQVRKFVSDAVSVSTFAAEKPAKMPSPAVSPTQKTQQQSHADSNYPFKNSCNAPNSTQKRTLASSSHVVRDPFSSTITATNKAFSADHVPFDDDEDAIIQEFEREMQKCHYSPSPPSSSLQKPRVHKGADQYASWSACDYDLYDDGDGDDGE